MEHARHRPKSAAGPSTHFPGHATVFDAATSITGGKHCCPTPVFHLYDGQFAGAEPHCQAWVLTFASADWALGRGEEARPSGWVLGSGKLEKGGWAAFC